MKEIRPEDIKPDEPVVIVTIPTTMPKNLATATIGVCSGCLCSVWVAPSTRDLMLRVPHAKLLCGTCAYQHAKEEADKGEDVEVRLVPGVIKEAVDQLAKDRATPNN